MNAGARRAALLEARPQLSAGIVAGNWLAFGQEVQDLEEAGAQLVHIDVMDGHFCPGVTVGAAFVRALQTSMLKDVHLMIEDPENAVEEYVAAGADMITVHVESTRHVHRVLQVLAGAKSARDSSQSVMRGLALNPGTPVELVEPFLDEVELVLLLAVNPGWSGQQFISSTEARLRRLRRLMRGSTNQIVIGVDGGVTSQNIGRVAAMGADLIVAGRACFEGGSTVVSVRRLMAELRRPNNAVGDSAIRHRTERHAPPATRGRLTKR